MTSQSAKRDWCALGYPLLAYLLSALFFVAIKESRAILSIGTTVWIRYVMSAAILTSYGVLRGYPVFVFPRGSRIFHIRRTVYALGAFACFTAAAPFVTASEFVSLLLASPLILACLGWIMLKEQLTSRRVGALLVGFFGVVLIVGFDGASLKNSAGMLVLTGCVLGALCDIDSKRLTGTQHPYSVTTVFFIIGSILSTATLPWIGELPLQSDITSRHLWWILALGITGCLSQLFLVNSFKRLPASVVAPLGYTTYIWALLFDLVLLGTLPGATAVFGAVLVVIGGLGAMMGKQAAA